MQNTQMTVRRSAKSCRINVQDCKLEKVRWIARPLIHSGCNLRLPVADIALHLHAAIISFVVQQKQRL